MIYVGHASLAELDGETCYFAVVADGYTEAVAKVLKESGPVWEMTLREVGDGNVIWLGNKSDCDMIEHENNF